MEVIKPYLLILSLVSGLLVSQTIPAEALRLHDYVHITGLNHLRLVSRRVDHNQKPQYPPSPRPGKQISVLEPPRGPPM